MAETRRDIDTVVFDIGNVLLDWNPRYLYRKVFSDEAEMERFFSEIATTEWHIEQDRGRTTSEATGLLLEKHPEYRDEISAYYDRWDEMFGGPIQGTVEILEELDRHGYALYALTNWSAELFVRTRSQHDFLKKFREIVVSGEVGLLKPEAEIYYVLIERTGLDPRTSVFIDDSPANVEGAESLGFTGVRFADSESLHAELAGLGLLAERTGL